MQGNEKEEERHYPSSHISCISSSPIPSNCCWHHLELEKRRQRYDYFLHVFNPRNIHIC